MKNPLNKRIFSEIKCDKGRYIAIFLFLILAIGFISGFIIADSSMIEEVNKSDEKYNIENGNFEIYGEVTPEIQKIADDEQISLYENFYIEEAVLKNIDFSCHKGQKIAVIGSTGSGKSTLVKLMNRFYDVSRGSIEINGVDIRKYDLESLRAQIGYVAQKAHMFKGSIKSNICFGKPEASDEEMHHAARVAQASDFISKRENGYLDEIAEDGTNISGGQKQRLSIARVILKKPSLYIYDDSFSALDFKTDATLRKALKPEVKDAIFFVVAQRISTIMDSDMIIVLDEGQIIGLGTHLELLKNCSVYQEIAHSQLTQKELDDYERN